MARSPTGIRSRHGRACRSHDGGACSCHPSYEAFVYSVRDGRKIRRTFRNLAEAKSWRADGDQTVRKGGLRTPSRLTLREAAEKWLEQAERGESFALPTPLQAECPAWLPGRVRALVFPGSRRRASRRRAAATSSRSSIDSSATASPARRCAMCSCPARPSAAATGDRYSPIRPMASTYRAGRRASVVASPIEAAALWRPAGGNAGAVGNRRLRRPAPRRAPRAARVRTSARTRSASSAAGTTTPGRRPKSRAGMRGVAFPATLRAILDETPRADRAQRRRALFSRTPTPRSHRATSRTWPTRPGPSSTPSASRSTSAATRTQTYLDAAGISETRADRYMGHSNRRSRIASGASSKAGSPGRRSSRRLPRRRHRRPGCPAR